MPNQSTTNLTRFLVFTIETLTLQELQRLLRGGLILPHVMRFESPIVSHRSLMVGFEMELVFQKKRSLTLIVKAL
ncbi:hypothetical protein XELAEV_18032883mg [Xenopus laevis]|uniref:Uncharacterized protein n=1 Tax=Xenopus laevis TaxID=8355 RepID=A0A974CJP7_XENLA|nr:hypothetical protein XELAEV_18032883mg [Xenopus laevis]